MVEKFIPRPGNGPHINPSVEGSKAQERAETRIFMHFMRALVIATATAVGGDTHSEQQQTITNTPTIVEPSKPTKEVDKEMSDAEILSELRSIRYENHPVLTSLDRAVFCIFFNEFLKGKEHELLELWGFMTSEMAKGELSKESEEVLNKIYKAVIDTKKEFSKKSIFTLEGIASGFIPGSEKEIVDNITSFLKGKKNTQDGQKGFKKVFEVINRNEGLSKKIEGLFKDLIDAFIFELKNDLEKGTQKEKEEARKLIKILIKTLKVLEVKK